MQGDLQASIDWTWGEAPEYRDGTADGGDYDLVKTAFPDLWTDDHRLTNQATLFARFTAPSGVQFNKAFPHGHNTTVQVEAKGVPVLDVRSGAVGYHDNAGLCLYDYFTCLDGYAIPQDRMNTASFAAFADLSDEAVTLKDGGSDLLQPCAGYTGPVPRNEGQLSDALIAETRRGDCAHAKLRTIGEILNQEKPR